MPGGGVTYGLVAAGPVHSYFAAELPRLQDELGPVAAVNRRTASRIVNTLRAGTPCELREIVEVQGILICAPGKHLQPLLNAMHRQSLDWRGKSLVLCECVAYSRQLACLRSMGASVASLRAWPGPAHRFLVEGDREALKLSRYLVAQLSGVAVEMRPEDFPFLRAASTFADSFLTPVFEACMRSLRQTSLSGAHATQTLEAMVLQTLRGFLYSGSRSWSGVVAEGDEAAMRLEREALEAISPKLAAAYTTYGEAARALLGNKKLVRLSAEKD